MRRKEPRYVLPALATLLIHGALGTGLHLAGELVDRNAQIAEAVEIEIIEPPPRVEPLPPPPPPPEPEPEAEPEPEPEPPKPKPLPRKVAPEPEEPEPVDEPPPTDEPPPEPSDEPPAPGPVISNDAPAPVIRLPGIAPGGTGPPVAVGRPTGRRVGAGGTGKSTRGGGGGAPGGTGGPAPAPVSIASIKTQAKPLNPDLDTGKLYPPEARRLGIEGIVQVRLVVDERGKVASRRLITRLGYGLDELAMQLATRLRFEPARDTADRPVRSVVVWKFSFVLPE